MLGAGAAFVALVTLSSPSAASASTPPRSPTPAKPKPKPRKPRPRGTVTPGEPTRVDIPPLGRQVVPPLDRTKGGGETRPITRAEAAEIARKMFADPTLEIDGLTDADWALIEEENHKQTLNPSREELHRQALALEAARLAHLKRTQITSKIPPITVDSPKREPPPSEPPLSPPTPVNLERARKTAEDLAKHIRTKKDRYDRKRVAQFQADAGLVPDGLYGPVTASALRYFGVRNSPPAVFRGKHTAYQPPE